MKRRGFFGAVVTAFAGLSGLRSHKAQASEAKGMQAIEWIPVGERLPDKPGRYLVASPRTVFVATRKGSDWADVAAYDDWTGELRRYTLHGITHWAELPSVPTLDTEVTLPPIGAPYPFRELTAEERKRLIREFEKCFHGLRRWRLANRPPRNGP